MKYLLTLVVSTALLAGVATAQAHPGHKHVGNVKAHASGNWSCHYWVSHDPSHPNAPDSYSVYWCQEPEGDWTIVHATGKYTGNYHRVKLQRRCTGGTVPILGCVAWSVLSWDSHP